MLENITNRRVAITMNAINDEIIVLRSETPMLEVAKRLDQVGKTVAGSVWRVTN